MPLASSASTRRRHLRAEAARLRLESEAEALEEVQTQETQRREKPRKTEADGRQLLRAFAIALACALLLEGAFRVLVSLVRGSGSRGGALSAFDALRASHEDVARALPPPRLYMVIGERNSGANWVRAMLRDNVPADALAPADADDEEALAHAHLRVPVTGVHHRAHHIEEHGEGDERYRLDDHGLDGGSAHSTHVYRYRAHHAMGAEGARASRVSLSSESLQPGGQWPAGGPGATHETRSACPQPPPVTRLISSTAASVLTFLATNVSSSPQHGQPVFVHPAPELQALNHKATVE